MGEEWEKVWIGENEEGGGYGRGIRGDVWIGLGEDLGCR